MIDVEQRGIRLIEKIASVISAPLDRYLLLQAKKKSLELVVSVAELLFFSWRNDQSIVFPIYARITGGLFFCILFSPLITKLCQASSTIDSTITILFIYVVHLPSLYIFLFWHSVEVFRKRSFFLWMIFACESLKRKS